MNLLKTCISFCLLGSMIFTNCAFANDKNMDGTSKSQTSLINSSSTIEGGWDNEFIGSDPTIKFYPDAYANYWRFGLNRKDSNKNIGLKITGVFPDARYMSINVYNDSNFSPIESITDYDIVPDEGSINQFASLEDNKYKADQHYTIYVVPKGTKNISGKNVVYYDNSLNKISVFLRYYLPNQDDKGGAVLPTIEAFDTTTGEKTDLPKTSKNVGSKRMHIRSSVGNYIIKTIVRPFFLVNRTEDLHSYHLSGNGMYPNKDNDYLVMPITRKNDEVAVVKFKAPTLSKVNEKDVRYFSLGQGDIESHNLLTLCDEEIKIADDGYVYLVIGDTKVKNSLDANYNYMPWKADSNMVLIYRNLVSNPNFEGNINLVPNFKENKKATGDAYIGDYAPVGKLVTYDEFINKGFDVLK
ncbi:hypothetical protein PV797_15600 [Clostridiaceae bacterium M8S5]|nr:hypothetical protein PV797_15600 [Clostridiaceae bacterium M8S5]